MSRPSRETLIRYFRGQCLPYEIELIELYLSMHTDKEYVEACIAEVWDELAPYAQSDSGDNDLEKFRSALDQKKRTQVQLPPLDHPEKNQRPVLRLPSWIKAVAAAAILIGGTALAIYNTQLKTSETQVVQNKDIFPGSDRASLTLSDGSTISLSGLAKGKIAIQQGLTIEKTSEGEIVYKANGGNTAKTRAFNTVTTPNGGQYMVALPDGSKARLNAASSLTYPVHFSEKERRVKITGEVYFEIAKASTKNKRIPFFVKTAKQEIQVLGTVFNVNAYADEPHQMTTLVEGSVRLKSMVNGSYTMLKPGQRAVVGNSVTVSDVDMKQDLAWVNGNFIFQREELGSILRKISRWYDLEVECPAELANMKFTGKVSRNQPPSAVVEMISATNKINVQIKGRRIIVKK